MLAIVLALKLPTILILAWASCRPEEMFRPGRQYWGVLAIVVVHVSLALLSLTVEKSSLYELFVAYPLIWSVLLRDRIRGVLSSPASVWLMGDAVHPNRPAWHPRKTDGQIKPMTPSQVQRSAQAFLLLSGTPAPNTRPAGKGTGRQNGYRPVPRKRYDIVFKTKKAQNQPQTC